MGKTPWSHIDVQATFLENSEGPSRAGLFIEPNRTRDLAKVLIVAGTHGADLGLTEDQINLAEAGADALCERFDWDRNDVVNEMPFVSSIKTTVGMSGKAWLWVSWEQPCGEPPDCRPLQCPPADERILGWWLTAEGEDHYSICAAILATTDEDAREAVLSGWPEAFERKADWRIFQPSEGPWDGSDRFILSDWMLPRLAVLEEGVPAPRAGGVRGREAGEEE